MDKTYHYYQKGQKLELKKSSTFMGNLLQYSNGSSLKLSIENSKLVKVLKEDFEAETVKFDRIIFFGKPYLRVWVQNNYKFYCKL